MSTPHQAQLIRQALSVPRMGTYERAVVAEHDYIAAAALDLYNWNAQVSGAFMAPLHICEVVVRNAVSDALTAVYGPNWPWSKVLKRVCRLRLFNTIRVETYKAIGWRMRRPAK